MESGGVGAAASSMALRSRANLVGDYSIEEKRRKMETGGAQSIVWSTALQRRMTLGRDGRPVDDVLRADLLSDCKHGDGSINRSTDANTDFWSKVFCLKDTNETCVEPMMMAHPRTSCLPDWTVCEAHDYCSMLQIFSLNLAYTITSVGSPVQLYGYLAVRDLLNPLRNYIFKRTRDDPFVVQHDDGFIQMSGPKRGIKMHGNVLIEFDMKIKRGEEEGGDLELIDGAFCMNDITPFHARLHAQRITGDYGAVDISYALLHCAAEATAQVEISELQHDTSLSLCLTAYYIDTPLSEKVRLFDDVVTPQTYELNRFVVAVESGTSLVLDLKLSQTGVSNNDGVLRRFCLAKAKKHGVEIFIFHLGFANVQIKVTWSTLDIPRSLLGPNCYQYAHEAFDAALDENYE